MTGLVSGRGNPSFPFFPFHYSALRSVFRHSGGFPEGHPAGGHCTSEAQAHRGPLEAFSETPFPSLAFV